MNDDRIPVARFSHSPHPTWNRHYVLDGELAHKDSMGNGS